MPTYNIGYFVGSLSSTSINRVLSKALIRLAPEDMEFTEIPIGNLPLYNRDLDANYPPEATALKEAIAAVDAVLFVTPEYNRSIPGALKNHRLGLPAVREKLVRPHSGGRDRSIPWSDRHSCRPAEYACRSQLLQRPAHDRTRGVHPVLTGRLYRRR